MFEPLVSYIIPSYNHAKYIDQAIQSVLNQSYANIELIIVDDYSIDNTKAVLKKYEENKDITVIYNEKNLKQSATLNKALSIAKGEFVGFLPSDDWIYPYKVKHQIQKFSEVSEKVAVIYGRGKRYFEDEQLGIKYIEAKHSMHRENILEKLLTYGNFIYPVTPLFKKECFDKYPFDETYTAEGEAIYLKLALSYEFDYVDEIVGVMRDHPGNTGKKTDIMLEENIRYYNDFFNSYDVPSHLEYLKNERIAKLCRIKAMENIFLHKRFIKGRELCYLCFKNKKTYIFDMKLMMGLMLTYMPNSLTEYLIDSFYIKKQSY